MMTGKVEVSFYELGAKVKMINRDFASKELHGESKIGGKKCVVSSSGSYELPSRVSGGFTYKRGKHLCTITLHYCTAVGLILNKILDAPPASEAVVSQTAKAANVVTPMKGEPGKKRSNEESFTDDDIVVLPAKKVARKEALDLTGEEEEVVDLTGDDNE